MVESRSDVTWLGKIARGYLCLVAFGLPFLFGCQLMATENANFPTDLLVWMVLGFTPSAPCFLAALLSGIGLLLSVLAYPRKPAGDVSLWWCLVWFAPFAAGLIGHCVSTETDYSLNWLLHFWGAGTYGLSVWWASRHDRKLLRCWCLSVGLGTALLCAYGYYQRFGGLAWHLEEMKRQHLEEYGRPLPFRMEQKLMQQRVNSYFSDPNVFAAHLLVTLPVLLLGLMGNRRLREFRGVDWAKLLVALALGLVMFAFTGSRGGTIGLLVGVCVGIWTLPWLQRQRWKWSLPLLAVILALGVWAYSRASLSEGQVSTASVRFEYYRVAWEMFCESPLTGKGLGEFFPYFVRMKALGAEMTRDPHSFFMGTLSQCGILGGLGVLLALSFPFVMAFRRTRWRNLEKEDSASSWGLRQVLPLAGLAGWSIHSFFQFNELIPGTVYLLPVLPLLVLRKEEDGVAKTSAGLGNSLGIVAAVIVSLISVIWPVLKIPAESRLQAISEEMHFLRRDELQLSRGMASGNPEDILLRLSARREKIKDDLLALSKDMDIAPAPCKLLLEMVHEELFQGDLEAPVSARNQDLLKQAANQLVERTPHRSTAHTELAWVYLACGEAEKAQEQLKLAREWYPGDGSAYMLEAVPAGNLRALRLLDGLKSKVVRDEDGVVRLLVLIIGIPEERQQEIAMFLRTRTDYRFELTAEDF